MNLETETYLAIAKYFIVLFGVLPCAYLICKTILQLYKPHASKQILLNWIVLVAFLWIWNLAGNILYSNVYLLIGAIFKAGICLAFEKMLQFANIPFQKYNMKDIKKRTMKLIINIGCDWNFLLTKFIYKYANDQQKRLMKDRYNSIFQQTISPVRITFKDISTQTQIITHQKQIKEGSQQLLKPIIQQRISQSLSKCKSNEEKKVDPISFKKLFIEREKQRLNQSQINIKSHRDLSMSLNVKQSQILLQQIASPRKDSENQIGQFRRMNTFSHRQKEGSKTQRWRQQLNISISEEYSCLMGSDDEINEVELKQKPKKIEKRMIRKRQYKKEITVDQQQPKSNTSLNNAQKNTVGKAQIYLQTGNSIYKLQKKTLKLYQNDEVEILSRQNVLIESFTIFKIRALRSDFFQIRGQTSKSIPVSRIIRFRGQHSVFVKYIQSKLI